VPATELQAVYNAPNPFSTATNIAFELSSTQTVTLDVYSLLGRRVAGVQAGRLPGGLHRFRFEADGRPAGTYFYRLCVDEVCVSRPMVLLR
jgi:hypothetical protein